jgi:hypothetical protein
VLQETITREVDLPAISKASLLTLLQYMYTGHITLTHESTLPLLALANQFEIAPLQELCNDFVMDSVTTQNCTALVATADRTCAFQAFVAVVIAVAMAVAVAIVVLLVVAVRVVVACHRIRLNNLDFWGQVSIVWICGIP